MTRFLSKFRQARGSLYEESKESSLLSGSLYSIQENEAFALPVPLFLECSLPPTPSRLSSFFG